MYFPEDKKNINQGEKSLNTYMAINDNTSNSNIKISRNINIDKNNY